MADELAQILASGKDPDNPGWIWVTVATPPGKMFAEERIEMMLYEPITVTTDIGSVSGILRRADVTESKAQVTLYIEVRTAEKVEES
jgi:hypothetical protein